MLQHQRTGSGPAIVLIHGLLGSHDIYSRLVPLLADDFDVITLDLPGHGGSPVPDGVTTMADAADEVVTTLDSLGVSDPIIVGHSWGGYVTCEVIARHSEKLRGAAIIYSQPYGDPPEKQASRTDLIARFESEPWDDVVRDMFPVYFADYDPPELFEEAIGISTQASVDGARFALTTIRDRADHSDTITSTSSVPVLFVSGTDDAAMPPITLEASHVRHHETRSSHMGPMTVPGELADVLRSWIAEVDLTATITEKLARLDTYGLRPGTPGGAPRNEYDLEARELAQDLLREGSIDSSGIDAVWQHWFSETLSGRIGSDRMSTLVADLNGLVGGGKPQ